MARTATKHPAKPKRGKKLEVEEPGVLYGRYSSHNQKDISVEQQFEKGYGLAGEYGIRIVDTYADRAVSGRTDKRKDFQRMMADCRRGLIDQILVKSISRFARNTKDCLEAVRELKELGVDIETNMVIGKVLTIDELMGEYGYEAVFVGSGAGLPRFMNIPGESLKGVYSANEFLTRSNLMKAYLPTSKTPIRTGKKVAVVGGGNVAMDAARSALRLGAETVYIVYRRGMAELPARKEEVEHAEEEGIIFKTLCNPVAIHPDEDGFVHSMTCIEMELGEPDASGRRRPIEKQGSEFELEVDIVRVRKMQKSHVSLAVNKLCEKGYIQKETDAADRKKVHLKLEESASEIIRFGQDCQRAFGESLFSGISREDREEFLRLCELIRRNVTEK